MRLFTSSPGSPRSKAYSRNFPPLKQGQLVRGTVKRHAGNGMILTEIKGRTLLASSTVSVRVGDELILKVRQLRPKPQLQVVEALNNHGDSGRFSGLDQAFQFFWEEDLPITDALWKMTLNKDRQNWTKQFLADVQRQTEVWRRFLWNISFRTPDEVKLVQDWLSEVRRIFAPEVVERIVSGYFGGGVPYDASGSLAGIIADFTSWIRNLNGTESSWARALVAHEGHWQRIRSLHWERSQWYGGLMPFLFSDMEGLAATSIWNPAAAESLERPARLAFLACFKNGWTLHGLIEYRTKDVVGTIDVNSSVLKTRLEEQTGGFYRELSGKGYQDTFLRVEYDPAIAVDYRHLIPEKPTTQEYTV